MRAWIVRLVLVAAMVMGASARAAAQEGGDDDSVESHLALARTLYQAGRFSQALQEFETANAIAPAPVTELFIARCHDRLGHAAQAVTHYGAFLRMAPKSPQATEARRRMAALKRDESLRVAESSPEASGATDGGSDESDDAAARRHSFGFGFGLGGGYRWAKTSVGDFSAPQLNLLDISFFAPISGGFEFHFFIPLAGIVLNTLLNGPTFAIDLGAKIYPSGRSSGFFLEPGLGFQYVSVGSGTGEALGLPVRIGYEAASDRRGFGFSFAVKPDVAVLFASSGSQSAVGFSYGVVGEISFNFYATRAVGR